MSLNVTAVNDYIKNNGDLITEFVLQADTISTGNITIMDGVKYKEKINYLDTDALVQRYACGEPTSSGSTVLVDKDVIVYSQMVYEEFCPEDLNPTVFANQMPKGLATKLPFEQLYVQYKGMKIGEAIENMIWQDTTGSTAGITDGGWIYKTNRDTDCDGLVFDFSTATGTTDIINAVWAANELLPEAIQDRPDKVMFLSGAAVRNIAKYLVLGNYYSWAELGTNYLNDGFMFPNTNIMIRPTKGLSTTAFKAQWVLTPSTNLIFATDLLNEFEKFKIWWSDDDNTGKYLSTWKNGVSYYFGEYIVTNKA